jgi:hypothetical protein
VLWKWSRRFGWQTNKGSSVVHHLGQSPYWVTYLACIVQNFVQK